MNYGESANRRDRHDIVVEILKSALDGQVKTHIMYKAKLSYAQLNEYLPLLIEKGFIENVTIKHGKQCRKIFKTTFKGVKFLENFESVNKLWAVTTESF
jgi:predicted transcriptional regulator